MTDQRLIYLPIPSLLKIRILKLKKTSTLSQIVFLYNRNCSVASVYLYHDLRHKKNERQISSYNIVLNIQMLLPRVPHPICN